MGEGRNWIPPQCKCKREMQPVVITPFVEPVDPHDGWVENAPFRAWICWTCANPAIRRVGL